MEPEQNQMQGPPVSPPEAPVGGYQGMTPGSASGGGIPMENQPGGLSQEEMKANLGEMMSKIEGKYQDFNANKFASLNQREESKGNTLRRLFDMFNKMGVDPSDPEQVREFLNKLKEVNPELSKQLEGLLERLLGEDIPGGEGEVGVDKPLGEEIPVTEDPLVGQGQPVPPTGGMGAEENMNMQNNVPPQENI